MALSGSELSVKALGFGLFGWGTLNPKRNVRAVIDHADAAGLGPATLLRELHEKKLDILFRSVRNVFWAENHSFEGQSAAPEFLEVMLCGKG